MVRRSSLFVFRVIKMVNCILQHDHSCDLMNIDGQLISVPLLLPRHTRYQDTFDKLKSHHGHGLLFFFSPKTGDVVPFFWIWTWLLSSVAFANYRTYQQLMDFFCAVCLYLYSVIDWSVEAVLTLIDFLLIVAYAWIGRLWQWKRE